MITSPIAVVDAGLAVFAVLQTSQSEFADRTWNRLQQEGTSIYVPRLWRYEVTSVIHKYLFEGLLEPELGEKILSLTLELVENVVDEDPELCRAAFRWANRLNQKPAYHGFYLAVAEALEAQFWTADRKLANNAQSKGVHWVHWFGE